MEDKDAVIQDLRNRANMWQKLYKDSRKEEGKLRRMLHKLRVDYDTLAETIITNDYSIPEVRE